MRHHYSVTAQGLADVPEQRFHSFEEANAVFDARVHEAESSDLKVVEQSYWRRQLAGDGRHARVSLDDIGLVPCGPACGAGSA